MKEEPQKQTLERSKALGDGTWYMKLRVKCTVSHGQRPSPGASQVAPHEGPGTTQSTGGRWQAGRLAFPRALAGWQASVRFWSRVRGHGEGSMQTITFKPKSVHSQTHAPPSFCKGHNLRPMMLNKISTFSWFWKLTNQHPKRRGAMGWPLMQLY